MKTTQRKTPIPAWLWAALAKRWGCTPEELRHDAPPEFRDLLRDMLAGRLDGNESEVTNDTQT